MCSQLNQLRDQIAAIDREIVAALAQRSQCGAPARHAPPVTRNDDPLTTHIRADYVRMVADMLCPRELVAAGSATCEAADATLQDAVCRRLCVVLKIAQTKAAGQQPLFNKLVAARDIKGIEQAITHPAIEEQVVARAGAYARELPAAGLSADFPDRVTTIYRDWIIPLARRVEVEMLLAGNALP